MPEIAVLMPMYNTREEYLRAAVESILTQTFTDFELIIVNDGSTDKRVEQVIKSYKDKRIRYFAKENGGAASARNFAISKADGKYLALMDSDDISLPERLQKQYDYLEAHSEVGCLGTKTRVIEKQARKLHFPKPVQNKEIENYLLFYGCVFCNSSVMLRRDILEQNHISYRDEYIPAEDYALWLDLTGKTQFAVLDELLVYYRFFAENISNRQKEKQRKKCTAAQIAKWREICNLPEIDEELYNKFANSETLGLAEMRKLNAQLQSVISGFAAKGFAKADLLQAFCKRFKKHYYKTRTFKGQLKLWKSPLNQLFGVSFPFRLFCLITRGVL